MVNPAAIQVEGTPISGMPILMAHEAKTVVCCNFDRKPGYSGVVNPLYEQDNTICLEGDAKATLSRLLQSLAGDIATREAPAKTGPMPAATEQAARLLAGAGSVIMIPGYGMALAKAQFNWWNWPHGLSAKARA